MPTPDLAAAAPPQRLMLARFVTPTGVALLVCDETGALRALDWEGYEERMQRLLRRHYGALQPVEAAAPAAITAALDAYFAGEVGAIDQIRVASNGTPFQRLVWAGLRQIPAGQTLSYAQLGSKIGVSPKTIRAVGQANGANPIGLVVPCHRVIAADGGLGGYAAGLARKRWLLTHEGAPLRADAKGGAAMAALPLFGRLSPGI